ncbi:hypothetical protein D3C84_693100 [compost metagenome]
MVLSGVIVVEHFRGQFEFASTIARQRNLEFLPGFVDRRCRVFVLEVLQRYGFADLQVALVVLHVFTVHLLQTHFQFFPGPQAAVTAVPGPGADKGLSEVAHFVLPAGFGGLAQRLCGVEGGVVETGELAVEPVVGLGFAEAVAAQQEVMGGLGLVQRGLRLAQLQLSGFVLRFKHLKLGLDLLGFEFCLVAGLGPFLVAAIIL